VGRNQRVDDSPDHGPRISGEEYDRGVVEIYSALPAEPSKRQERAARRRELELTIDHRLGREFPAERRQALWEVAERIEKRRFRLLFWHLLRRIWPGRLPGAAQALAADVVAEYGKVLNPQELERYFGAEEVRHPGLPIDRSRRP